MKAFGSAFNFISPSLTRMAASRKQLVAPSVNVSRGALEFQIELRARLLKDLELVRSRLRDSNGAGHRCRVDSRRSDRRRPDNPILHRTKLNPNTAISQNRAVTIAQRFQSVNPTELL